MRLLLIALALVLFVGFARFESGVQRRGGDPLIVPTLFGNRAFTGGLATGLAIFTSMVGFALVFAVFLQAGLGFSPLKAGLTVLPQALGSLVGFAAAAVGLTQRLGRRSLQHPPLLENRGLVYRRGLAPGKPLQMIASSDIGFFAATAFDDPSTIGAKIELAGDELAGDQIAETFQRHTGLPTRFEPVPMAELQRQSEWQATAYGWLNRIGYRADIPALRRQFPELLTLAGWLARTGWAPSTAHSAPPAAGVPRTS